MSKKNAGQQILEHDSLGLDLEADVIEYRRLMEPELMRKLYETAWNVKKAPQYIGKNFYVVLTSTVEAVLRQPKNIMWARMSCPTPVYKQSVWKYHTHSDNLEFLWSIPEKILYYHIVHNKAKYVADKECSDLAKFVLLMEAGELLEWVKKENGEKKDAVIKLTKESYA